MKRWISPLQKMPLRQVCTTFLIGLVCLVTLLFGQVGTQQPVQAASLTPEAKSYQVDQSETRIQMDGRQIQDKAEEAGEGFAESLKDAADTVREKLNLDEPLPESTKDFFKQIRGEEVTIEEPRPFGK